MVVFRARAIAGLERQQASAVMRRRQQPPRLGVAWVFGQQPFPQAQRPSQVLDAFPGLAGFVFDQAEPLVRGHEVAGRRAIGSRTLGQGLADRHRLA